jgi:AAA-like domain/CHAT domain
VPVRKILVLTANPRNSDRLRLDEEVREIQSGLERSQQRDRFEIILRWAVRTEDLRRALLDFEPQIVHFSGHGAGKDGLVLENGAGQSQLVGSEALAELFGLCNSVECVLLNACYSEKQAKAINEHIDCVVGMNEAIGDRAAINFAIGFYDGLGAGRSYENAFKLGCNAIALKGIPEAETPVLKLKSPERPLLPDSDLYVKRQSYEADCYQAMLEPGALIKIKAPKQMGKTSLMNQILNHARKQEFQTIKVNFGLAEHNLFTDLDQILRWLCQQVGTALGQADQLEANWQKIAGSKVKCKSYFEECLLAELDKPLVLALDSLDLLFPHTKVFDDFSALLRDWNEAARAGDAISSLWQKLRLVLVFSTESFLPSNLNQSPLDGVGTDIKLPEFNAAQVQDLANRYGLTENALLVEQLMMLVGGHPYLVRQAFHELQRSALTLEQLIQTAPTEAGIYRGHLRRHWSNLQQCPDVRKAMREVVGKSQPVLLRPDIAFKLGGMGLVKLQGNGAIPRCNLYRQYFLAHLGS